MESRMYYAETVESLISNLKEDYLKLMKQRMEENETEKVNMAQAAINALGILEDRLFRIDTEKVKI